VGNNKVVAGQKAMGDPVLHARAEVSKAKNVLDDLTVQQAALVTKELSLRDEKKKIGYDTFARKDEASRTRLSKITAEHFLLESELDSIGAAIQEANKRLAASQETERVEIQKAKARQVLAQLVDLNDAAAACDIALEQFLVSFGEMERQAAAICQISGHPQWDILCSLSRRALQTHFLGQVRVFHLDSLQPGQRLTFADMSAGWSRIGSAWAAQRLGAELGILPDLDAPE
jgi:hypothetical protein